MKWSTVSIVFLFIVLFPISALSKTITVAVLDTGIDRFSNDKLCKSGHKSFVKDDSDPLMDHYGHGTHIAGLIRKEAGLLNYCIVSVKYWSSGATPTQNADALLNALRFVNNIKVDFINISGGGPVPDEGEKVEILKALNRGAKVVLAAGNEGNNLDKNCNFFPACYDSRIIVVGNLKSIKIPSWINKNTPRMIEDTIWPGGVTKFSDGTALARAPCSNYGKRVTAWEVGTNLDSTLPNGSHGLMSGTSQATAVKTGKLIRESFL
jgi:subtilisin family serine protease